jgi:hypothetical protein
VETINEVANKETINEVANKVTNFLTKQKKTLAVALNC